MLGSRGFLFIPWPALGLAIALAFMGCGSDKPALFQDPPGSDAGHGGSAGASAGIGGITGGAGSGGTASGGSAGGDPGAGNGGSAAVSGGGNAGSGGTACEMGELCEGSCVNTATSEVHCGGCTLSCPARSS